MPYDKLSSYEKNFIDTTNSQVSGIKETNVKMFFLNK